MKGAHGLQPAGHEHVRCRFCNRPDAHTTTSELTDEVRYAPHSRNGSTVQCTKSILQTVHDEDRHRPAPGERS